MIDDIDAYDFLGYLPDLPDLRGRAGGMRLKSAVGGKGRHADAGACPGYFGDRGHVGQVQPKMGLDEVFGAREEEVEFMPDIGDRIHFKFDETARRWRRSPAILPPDRRHRRAATLRRRPSRRRREPLAKGRTLLIGAPIRRSPSTAPMAGPPPPFFAESGEMERQGASCDACQ